VYAISGNYRLPLLFSSEYCIVHRPQKNLSGDGCSGAVQGECLLPGGLEQCFPTGATRTPEGYAVGSEGLH
jgi:hypothetical protein